MLASLNMTAREAALSKKINFSKHKTQKAARMLFIFIAWLLVLLTFAVWLRALHSIPIYTETALEQQSQALQIQTVLHITQILVLVAVTCTFLHFALPSDVTHLPAHHAQHNTSLSASAIASYKNTS